MSKGRFYVIKKSGLQKLLDSLSEGMTVFIPVKDGDDYNFREMTPGSPLRIDDYENTEFPPRMIFMPDRETILEYEKNSAKAPAEPRKAARVFVLKNTDPDRVASALNSLPDVRVRPDRRLNMIVVGADAPMMPEIADIVQKMDQAAPPPRNVEVTFYILEAGAKTAGQDTRMPPALAPVLKQVSDMFGYANFTLFDAPVLRGREDQDVTTHGSLAFTPPPPPPGQTVVGAGAGAGYDIRFRPSMSVGPQARAIRLQDFRFDLYLPGSNQRAQINSDLDLREGQMVVIGKTGLAGPDRALIVVASGRIIE